MLCPARPRLNALAQRQWLVSRPNADSNEYRGRSCGRSVDHVAEFPPWLRPGGDQSSARRA